MSSISQAIQFRGMIESDATHIRVWLAEWLIEHLSAWNEAYGLDWADDEIEAHIAKHALLEREWDEIGAAAADPACCVRLAIAQGTPVGIVYVEQRIDRYFARPIGALSWIYVDPSHRGRGIAPQLIAEAHQWLGAQGIAISEVFVTGSNGSAVAAYDRGGYRMLDHRMLAMIDTSDRAQR